MLGKRFDNQKELSFQQSSPYGDYCSLSPSETLASPLYFEIAKWAAGTGCFVELPIPMGRPFEKQESEP
ncbi:MAG: hypothetical protein EZS28_050545 [Streblomastix strix]|uniref:Uncharacterized protein n=1 Tax=Streblomastix strix TaxID=222440 RepID=A0A5J4T6W7_9EUKA|nr:MAG: hypothetical protein EZS28_050545 [Streblomastix strix]